MSRRTRLTLAAVVLALAGTGRPLADDWDHGPPGGYDVSVDLNVQGGVTVDSFQAPLAPYGDWVVVGNYGRAWRPRVAAGWRPYYHGRWEWTNEGWFWASDEPWGWAAYHYGRWAYDPYHGWLWVPGTEWAPAWVAWRSSGDAVGWAPLAPGFSVYAGAYPYVDLWWTFVPCDRFVSVPVHHSAYPPGHGRRWFDATAPAPARPPRGGGWAHGPAPAWGGPAPRVIEARIGRPVTPARIVRAPSPGWSGGRAGEVAVYRPERPGRDDGRGRGWRDDRPAPARAPGAGRGPAAVPPGRGGGDHRPPQAGGEHRGQGGAPQGGWRPEHAGGTPQGGGWSGGRPAGAPGGGGRAPVAGGQPAGGGHQGAAPQGGGHGGGAPQGGHGRGVHRP